MKLLKYKVFKQIAFAAAGLALLVASAPLAQASSHREAPLISMDPLADNTDLYAFRSPNDTNTITIIANYIPFESPEGGPNWYSFGENVRYEIHIKNKTTTTRDDITYRFTFTKTNEDPTTFFNIRLGKQNLKTTYKCEKSKDGGKTWVTIITAGVVPPPNIGPRSIEGAAGLNATSYLSLMQKAVTRGTGANREKVFAGPVDDPFFVDLGGIFDLGGVRQAGKGARDGLRRHNVHSIAMQIPISMLQATGDSTASSILDPKFVIGVWASASRPRITTLDTLGGSPTGSTDYVQVSRIGMPLTNEAIIPVGMKDKWNSLPPDSDLQFVNYFVNPELELYIDSTQFAAAVPGLSDSLGIQGRSYTALGRVNFRTKQKGLYVLKGSSYVKGTALDDAVFGKILLPNDSSPRSVDILPIFFTGVPNLAPYQLATGKAGRNPLAAGKPFINNFLPVLGDYLRLNMATPVTPRASKDFSSLGIVYAAVLGLLDPRYNTTTAMQFIPNMDGFPNGRRLEDDVTRIELQAVGGVALAAIGLPYDDYNPNSKDTLTWPLSKKLLSTVHFTAGPTMNDTSFMSGFPYMQAPWRGFTGNSVTCTYKDTTMTGIGMNVAPPAAFFKNSPNPFSHSTVFSVHVANTARISIRVYSMDGRLIGTVLDENKPGGNYNVDWNAPTLPSGTYISVLSADGVPLQYGKILITK